MMPRYFTTHVQVIASKSIRRQAYELKWNFTSNPVYIYMQHGREHVPVFYSGKCHKKRWEECNISTCNKTVPLRIRVPCSHTVRVSTELLVYSMRFEIFRVLPRRTPRSWVQFYANDPGNSFYVGCSVMQQMQMHFCRHVFCWQQAGLENLLDYIIGKKMLWEVRTLVLAITYLRLSQ